MRWRDPYSISEVDHFGEYARGVVKRYVTKAEVHAACDKAFAPLKFQVKLACRLAEVSMQVFGEWTIEHQRTLELARRARLFRFLDNAGGYSDNATAELIGHVRPVCASALCGPVPAELVEAIPTVEADALCRLQQALEANGFASTLQRWAEIVTAEAKAERHVLVLRLPDPSPAPTDPSDWGQHNPVARSRVGDDRARRSQDQLATQALAYARRAADGWVLRSDGIWHPGGALWFWSHHRPWHVQRSQLSWRQDEIKQAEAAADRAHAAEAPELPETLRDKAKLEAQRKRRIERDAAEVREFFSRVDAAAAFPELANAARAKTDGAVLKAVFAATKRHTPPTYTYTMADGEAGVNGKVVTVQFAPAYTTSSLHAPEDWQDELPAWEGPADDPEDVHRRVEPDADFAQEHELVADAHEVVEGIVERTADAVAHRAKRWIRQRSRARHELRTRAAAKRWRLGKAHVGRRLKDGIWPELRAAWWRPLPVAWWPLWCASEGSAILGSTVVVKGPMTWAREAMGAPWPSWLPFRTSEPKDTSGHKRRKAMQHPQKPQGDTLPPPWQPAPAKRSKWDAKRALTTRQD